MTRRSPKLPDPPPGSDAEARAAWPGERHSGEGAASALALLKVLEKRRGAARPADPTPAEDAEPNRPNA